MFATEVSKYEDFYKFMHEEIDNLHKLLESKNNEQYALVHPLTNFERGALIKFGNADLDAMFQVAKDYMLKHEAFVQDCGVANNKVGESLGDIAMYCLIMKYMVHKYQSIIPPKNN